MNNEKLETLEGKVCTKCGVWKPLEEYCKYKRNKDGRGSHCKECRNKQNKLWRENNKEYKKEYDKQWRENNKERYNEYQKQYGKQYRENNKEYRKEYDKQWRENNSEYFKQHYQNNKEHRKEQDKQYRENNKEYYKEYSKQYYQNNKEYIKEQIKQHYQNDKENNLQYISNMLEQINPRFKELELPIYGIIYKVTNIKTKHIYTGQTKLGLTLRYGSNIIKGWIEERKEKTNQKFLNELIEEDLIIEVIDVGCCRYHLDKMEAYYIDKYDSYNNGYNNNAGYHNTDDGIEEFNQILSDHNLEYKDGKLIQIKKHLLKSKCPVIL